MTELPITSATRSTYLRGALVALLGGFGIVVSIWAYWLWQLHEQVPRNERYWLQPHGETGGLRYVALGDSAAQAIGASDPAHGYVSLIAERLRRVSGRPVQVVNLSRSGARIRDVIAEQLPRLAALQADVITVAIGANDVTEWDQAAFAAAAIDLCAALPSDRTVVADVPDFMHGKWEVQSRAAAEMVRRECTARGVTVAPLHAAYEERAWLAMFTLYAADWFHPNNDGHVVWADTIWRSAESNSELRARSCGAQHDAHCADRFRSVLNRE